MTTRIKTASLLGLNAFEIEVEIHLSKGLPSFQIVGLPDTSIQEAKERVRAAIQNSGFKFPRERITINLAPAQVRKEGSGFDLSIAIGILLASKQIKNFENFNDTLFIGELSLDGRIRKLSNCFSTIVSCHEKGFANDYIIPSENSPQLCQIEKLKHNHFISLKDLVNYLNLNQPQYIQSKVSIPNNDSSDLDFSDVIGQQNAKRACEISAAGGHHILMEGPPGCGKSMIAKRLPSILTRMSTPEYLETTKIYSICGYLQEHEQYINHRPFRSPHHTASDISLIGGGAKAVPGEVSLAHNGVLFLDEILEFKKHVLESLRQPLSDGNINISRANMRVSYPANFTLIAALNPCPCGYYGDSKHTCCCSNLQIEKYRNRLSGPLRDRIDLHLNVPRVDLSSTDQVTTDSSSDILERVLKAKDIQNKRYDGSSITSNHQLEGKFLKHHCKMNSIAKTLLHKKYKEQSWSNRAYFKIVKLARTIADLSGVELIDEPQVYEAVYFQNTQWS
ncbi:MAG: YifB family Mg chelatase-like AAA ATPase [Candidatus Cloacimonetes bacterium]|nr:YifB family Mg chelatase-like AAA ATPase [Candidatus Cloacimonadota bacterium]